MKFFLAIIFSLLQIPPLLAQNVEIKGYINGFEQGSTIRIIKKADVFSGWDTTIAQQQIVNSNKFDLKFNISYPAYVTLAINLKKTSIFISPGNKMTFKIFLDTTTQNKSVFGQTEMEIKEISPVPKLNSDLITYNKMYNTFLINNFRKVFQYHEKQTVILFTKQINERFGHISSDYLKNYIKYTVASLKRGARMMTDQQFLLKYFINKPVLYHNESYGDMFLNFFNSYFKRNIKSSVNPEILAQVIPKRNYYLLDKIFEKDSLLKINARVRQLSEMLVLNNYFYNDSFDRKDIEILLQQIKNESKFIENRKVANHYLKKLMNLQPGTHAPEFILPDINGNEISLKSFSGKFVLLVFYKDNCPACEFQMNGLKNLQDNLGNELQPVVIMKGKNITQLEKFLVANNVSWPVLLLGNQWMLLEKYRIKIFPSYILINPNGTIGLIPAPFQEDHAVDKIRLYMNQYKKIK